MKLPATARMEALPYVPGPWYGETSAMKYTGLPGAGAGILNAGSCPDGTGVPLPASRAHELAGLVTPGKAVNGKRCVVAPVSCRVPLKEMSPGMAFLFAAVPLAGLALPAEDGLALPDEGAAAAEEEGGGGGGGGGAMMPWSPPTG